MASQTMHHHHHIPNPMPSARGRKEKNVKRALKSLAIAVLLPCLLTMTMILLFGSSKKYRSLVKPFWFPPLWLVHIGSLGTSFLMGLAGWLVWAEGGFHSQPNALPLYVSQVSLGIVWNPLVLVMGCYWVGFVFCLTNFGTLIACKACFGKVCPFAKDIVNLCVLWVAYLTLVTFKLASMSK